MLRFRFPVWVQSQEIGWAQYQEISWGLSRETRWVQSEEIAHPVFALVQRPLRLRCRPTVHNISFRCLSQSFCSRVT
jgi:hypothetical protein